MILKDEAHIIGAVKLWTFRITCDKCQWTVSVTEPAREETQQFVYNLGWRVNSRARKYIHLCKKCGLEQCGKKPRARKPELAEILYTTFRQSVVNNNGFEVPTWDECAPEVRRVWQDVADAAQDWAYENIQWQE